MGAVEEKRALLKHPSKTLAAQTQAARREWIRWTKILVTTAENAGISPADDALLFAPLREALQKNDARWHNGPAATHDPRGLREDQSPPPPTSPVDLPKTSLHRSHVPLDLFQRAGPYVATSLVASFLNS